MKRLAALLAAAALAAPAQARLVGYVETPEGRIDLYEEQGPCLGRAMRAEFVPPRGGTPVPGCWVAGGAFVMVVFMDADIAQIPAAAVVPPKSL